MTATEQPCCCGTCSSPRTRRCCGDTLPPREPHVVVPGSSSSEESVSLAADPAIDSTRAAVRHIISSQLDHSGPDRKPKLGLVRRRLIRTSRSAAANARNGPWCDMDQTKHAKLPQEYCQDAQCHWSQAGNPTTRRAGPAVSQEQLLSSDLRTM